MAALPPVQPVQNLQGPFGQLGIFIPLALDAVAQGRDDAEVDVHGLEVGDALVADIARQGADGGLLGEVCLLYTSPSPRDTR